MQMTPKYLKEPEICLGSAQFGMDYGITNKKGKVSLEEIKKILIFCSENNINLIDSAQSYGNAEYILGKAITPKNKFKLITKVTSQDKKEFKKNDIKILEKNLIKTLSLLKTKKLEALLLHHPKDLQKPGSEYLIDWLFSIKERGLVKRIGLSIYSSDDLFLRNKELIEIIQLPLSLYDQRLIENGTLDFLKKEGYEIHARSIYLQGLLLKPSRLWPNWIKEETKIHHLKLEQFALNNGYELIDMAIGFIKYQKGISSAIFGICSLRELKEMKLSWDKKISFKNSEWKSWASKDNQILTPQYWPKI